MTWGPKAAATTGFSAFIYQPMTAGDDEDLLTPTIMETGDIVELSDPTFDLFWTITGAGMFLSEDIDVALPAPVTVDSTEYTIDSGKSWRWLNEFNSKFVTLTIEKFFAIQNFSQMTVAAYYLPDHDTTFANFHDTITINSQSGSEFGVLQTNKASGNLTINAHSALGDSATIAITKGTKYWVNLLFDSTNELCTVGVFDSTTFEHIAGSPKSVAMGASEATSTISFGRPDGHAGNPSFGATNSSYLGQICFDVTGTFPLKPTVGSGSTKGWNNSGWG